MPTKWKDSNGNQGFILLDSELTQTQKRYLFDDTNVPPKRCPLESKLRKAIHSLPKKQREAIRLYYYQNLAGYRIYKPKTQEQIAQQLGINPVSFKRLLKRAKSNLSKFSPK